MSGSSDSSDSEENSENNGKFSFYNDWKKALDAGVNTMNSLSNMVGAVNYFQNLVNNSNSNPYYNMGTNPYYSNNTIDPQTRALMNYTLYNTGNYINNMNMNQNMFMGGGFNMNQYPQQFMFANPQY